MEKRKCSNMGIQIGNDNLYSLSFADDKIIFPQNEEEARNIFRKLYVEYRNVYLTSI